MNYFDNLKDLIRPQTDMRIDAMLDRIGQERAVDNTLTCKCPCGWVKTGEPNNTLVMLKKHKDKCEIGGKASSVKRQSKKFSLGEKERIRARMAGLQAIANGEERPEPPRGRPRSTVTRESIISQIKAMADELGRTPFYEEARKAKVVPSDYTMERLWGRPGPWSKALVEAGLTPTERGRPKK